MKMRFLPSRVTNCSRVFRLVWVDFWEFKMRFSRDVKPTVQEFIFCTLVSWKCDFCGVMKHMVTYSVFSPLVSSSLSSLVSFILLLSRLLYRLVSSCLVLSRLVPCCLVFFLV